MSVPTSLTRAVHPGGITEVAVSSTITVGPGDKRADWNVGPSHDLSVVLAALEDDRGAPRMDSCRPLRAPGVGALRAPGRPERPIELSRVRSARPHWRDRIAVHAPGQSADEIAASKSASPGSAAPSSGIVRVYSCPTYRTSIECTTRARSTSDPFLLQRCEGLRLLVRKQGSEVLVVKIGERDVNRPLARSFRTSVSSMPQAENAPANEGTITSPISSSSARKTAVHRACSAKRDERELPRLNALFDGQCANCLSHLRVGDVTDPLCERDAVKFELISEIRHRAFGGSDVERPFVRRRTDLGSMRPSTTLASVTVGR